jgi:hypothetical protein
MHYIQCVYLYWLSTRVRKRNVSILFKTIANAAEVTSTLTLNRHFGTCSWATSGQMVLPVKTRNIIFCSYEHLLQVTQKQNVSILSTHDDNRCHVTIPIFDHIAQYTSFSYVTGPLPVKRYFRSIHVISSFVRMNLFYRMSLSCVHMMIIGVMWPYRYLTLFRNIWASAMLRNHVRSNGTSGQNKKYHLLFVWPSPAITKQQNVSILSTQEDKRFLVTLPSF